MSVRLVVQRHGQTEWNRRRRMQGQTDVPLNELGVEQAAAAAPVLAAFAPARIVSSDLRRAAATARAVADTAGVEVTFDARLREIAYGQWEGLTREQIGPEALARVNASAENVRGVDGETLVAAAARTAEVFAEVVDAAADGETVLVVTHGTVARAGMQLLLGIPHELWEGVRTMGNCHWMVLEHDAGRWQLVDYNMRA